MSRKDYYQRLIRKFPEGNLGGGLEPTFTGYSHQPMT
ncbi:hypothetical protein J2S74_002719 [Evansella vedderi]|uniref:Uncharacterized protein n=1 Tax=Evansella vedderi TaxID=38282 RepID=A0ABT9ZVS5_9BACI|nr:hypothetical protein [Evansella vedderi]